MRRWLSKLCGVRMSSKGQTTAEYAIIVALVAVSSIATILIFGDQILDLFQKATTELEAVGDKATETPLDDF